MSDDEWRFIRFYCSAVARDYDLLQIIRALIAQDFNIKPLYTAIELGTRLYALQNTKIEELYKLGEKYGCNSEQTTTPPELIAEVFTQSFFKIVDSETKSVLILDKNMQKHDGWSSGQPVDWQQAIHAMQEIHAQKLQSKNTAESIFVSALFKLFALLPKGFSQQTWPQQFDDSDDWEYEDDDIDSGPDYPL